MAPPLFQPDAEPRVRVATEVRYLDLRRDTPLRRFDRVLRSHGAARAGAGASRLRRDETPTITRSTPEWSARLPAPAPTAPVPFYPTVPAAVQAAADGGGDGTLLGRIARCQCMTRTSASSPNSNYPARYGVCFKLTPAEDIIATSEEVLTEL